MYDFSVSVWGDVRGYWSWSHIAGFWGSVVSQGAGVEDTTLSETVHAASLYDTADGVLLALLWVHL